MSALNHGQRLFTHHSSQASLNFHIHRQLTRPTFKPTYSPRRPTTTSTYLPTLTSDLQIRSYPKHPKEIPKDHGKREPAISNSSAFINPRSADNGKQINKPGVASHKLKSRLHPPNHLLQIRNDESLVWGEDFIGYQLEHQGRPYASENDVGEEDQTAKNNPRRSEPRNRAVCVNGFFDAWVADNDIPREEDVGYQGLLSMSEDQDGSRAKSQRNAGSEHGRDACRTCRKECLFAAWKGGEDRGV